MNIIDTHVHIWDFDQARYIWLEDDTTILNRTYSLAELEPERAKAGVTSGVLVQAANNPEDTAWMLHVAQQTPWIKGIVGWLPLMEPEAVQKGIAQYGGSSYLKGIRHLIHNEPDSQWLLQPPVLESLQILADAGIPYDLVGILTDHIETALKVAEKIPTLRMVFDHLNQPPIATNERFGKWGDLMNQAAQHGGFYAKISGQGTASGNFSGWTADDIKPYIAHTLALFGTDRCFCGGDWPVSLLAGSYADTWGKYKAVLADLLSEADTALVLSENAERFYRL